MCLDWLCTRVTGGQRPFGETSIIISNLVTLSELELKQAGIALTTTEVHVCFGLLIHPARLIYIYSHFISDMHSMFENSQMKMRGLQRFHSTLLQRVHLLFPPLAIIMSVYMWVLLANGSCVTTEIIPLQNSNSSSEYRKMLTSIWLGCSLVKFQL